MRNEDVVQVAVALIGVASAAVGAVRLSTRTSRWRVRIAEEAAILGALPTDVDGRVALQRHVSASVQAYTDRQVQRQFSRDTPIWLIRVTGAFLGAFLLFGAQRVAGNPAFDDFSVTERVVLLSGFIVPFVYLLVSSWLSVFNAKQATAYVRHFGESPFAKSAQDLGWTLHIGRDGDESVPWIRVTRRETQDSGSSDGKRESASRSNANVVTPDRPAAREHLDG